MINREGLVKIGQFRKPHGTKGEISFSFDVIAGFTRNSLPDDSLPTAEPSFLICEIDRIFVPFCIESYRVISDSTSYIKLKNIDSNQQARLFTKKEVFFPKKYFREEVGDDSFTWGYFIGYTIIDERIGKIGRIIDVNTTTINILFIIEKGNEEILIPAVEDFIIRIDENQKELIVALPEGLVG